MSAWIGARARCISVLSATVGRVQGKLVRLIPQPDPVKSGLLTIGRHSYGVPSVISYRGDHAKVVFGSFVATGNDVEVFVGGNHCTEWVATFPFRLFFDLPGALDDGAPATKGDVIVGNDVWIGRGAKILSGVHVGNGAVIGAYSVVAKDVRPYAIVVGNPAREVRRRFTDYQIAALEALAWWEWPLDRILAAVPLLNGSDADRFVVENTLRPDPSCSPEY